jgi:hypothetical protein
VLVAEKQANKQLVPVANGPCSRRDWYFTAEIIGAVPTDILPSCLHGHSAPSGAIVVTAADRLTSADGPQCLRGLIGVGERPMIIRMTTTRHPQHRYDHRLRDLVHGTGDVTIATDLGVPRSTARGWLGKAPKVVVSLDVTDLRASELQQEVLELRRRVKKLTALLRLALALLRSSGFTLTHERLPDGRAKIRILQAVDRARACVPLRALLRFLRVSPSRFHAWRRLQHACALDDQSSCPHTSPHRLTPPEVRAIEGMVTALEYRHVPTGTLAVLAQRLGKVWASPSTWYRLVRKNGWRRPRIRVYPAKPKIGLRTTRADEMWHIDTTVIRLLDGSRAYLHAVIDNFSRRILAWRVAETFAPVNSVAVLVEASRAAAPSDTAPVVLASGRGRRERERSGRRIDPHGCPAPAAGLHGAEVLELHDRSVVALPETSMALPALVGQRHHGPSISRVLRPGTQPGASAFRVSRTDAGRDVLRHRGHGAGRSGVTRGRRAPDTR